MLHLEVNTVGMVNVTVSAGRGGKKEKKNASTAAADRKCPTYPVIVHVH